MKIYRIVSVHLIYHHEVTRSTYRHGYEASSTTGRPCLHPDASENSRSGTIGMQSIWSTYGIALQHSGDLMGTTTKLLKIIMTDARRPPPLPQVNSKPNIPESVEIDSPYRRSRGTQGKSKHLNSIWPDGFQFWMHCGRAVRIGHRRALCKQTPPQYSLRYLWWSEGFERGRIMHDPE